MRKAKKFKKFHARSFVTFFLLFDFFIMTVTGVILYFTPPGRIARWTSWIFLGMSKDQLEGIHTISSFAFLFFSLVHIFVLNRKAMWSYIKIRRKEFQQKRIKHKYEFLLAFVLCIVLFIGSYIPFTPFRDVIDTGDYLKKSWGKASSEAPVPNAESLTLKEFSKILFKKEASDVITILKSRSLQVESETQKIKEIARINRVSPEQIYRIVKTELALP